MARLRSRCQAASPAVKARPARSVSRVGKTSNAAVPAAILPSAWIRAGALATKLPSTSPAFKPVDMSSEANARRVTDSLATGAFKILQQERAKANPLKPPPLTRPKVPPPLEKIPPVPKEGSGGGLVLLLVVAALALSKGR